MSDVGDVIAPLEPLLAGAARMSPGGERPAWLVTIVERARFLWERIAADKIKRAGAPPPAGNPTADARLEAWSSRLGQRPGLHDVVHARLALAGLALEDAYPALIERDAAADAGEPLPDWALLLLRIERIARGLTSNDRSAPPVHASQPLPFEPLLLPAVLAGRELLAERTARLPLDEAERVGCVLSAGAQYSLERALLEHLAELCGKPLAEELSQRLSFGEKLVNDLDLLVARSTVQYDRFVDDTLADGLKAVLLAYPVLARLMATSVSFWVESSGELVERLSRDLPDLERIFSRGGRTLGAVAALNAILSDRHEHGRSVVALEFESGVRIVYKPRDLGLHLGFNRFLEYCNRHSGLAALESLQLLLRVGYGYVEFVDQRPCSSEAEAAAFYARAGMLLCILHVLRATDCHRENLVACGTQPVLIDIETILHPRDPAVASDDTGFVSGIAPQERFLDSVLRTGMLPRWRFSEDTRVAYDTSGLGSPSPQRVPRKVERWVNINTDAMHRQLISIDFPVEKNVASLGDAPLEPTRYSKEIRNGFCAMYDVLLRRQSDLLVDGGPLDALRGKRGRYVFRNSQVYGSVLHQAQTPEEFRDGASFSLAIEPLARAFVQESVPPRAAARLLDAELRALERQDIPLFSIDTGSTDLGTSDGLAAPDYFRQSSHDDVLDQVRGLSSVDRVLQAAIIDGAFDALAARTEVMSAPATERDAPILSDDELLREAIAIGDGFGARVLPNERGGVTWLGFGYVPAAERFQHEVLGDWLYDGTSGVALFLAALHRASGESRFADLARSAIADLRARACGPTRGGPPRRRFLGGALGVGSVLYALSEIAVLLDDETIAADALTLAQSITEGEVAADQRLDVMGGVAGTILGLAALYRVTGATRALDLAVSCGQRLVTAQTNDAWPTSGAVALLGMAHGAAGIAYSLIRLHALRPDPAFLDAAMRGISYERRLFSSATGNWPDLRPTSDDRVPTPPLVQWCHGAAGIGLARIGCAGLVASDALEREIDAALDATTAVGLGELDHVCCGSMGRIETMLAAAQYRGDETLRGQARAHISEMVRRARKGNGYRLFGNLERSVWNPGLFQGMAGIGYQVLRMRGTSVRSCALWE